MNLALKHVNALPAPTWLRLGVNDTNMEETIPELRPYEGEALVSGLPEGVVAEAAALPAMETGMGEEAVEFCTANRTAGVDLRIPAGVHVQEPVYLSYRLDATNLGVADVNSVSAEENSEVTVVLRYESDAETAGFHGGLTRLYAAKGAVIHLVQVQMLGDRCLHFDNIGALLEEGARVDLVQAELGAGNAASGFHAFLSGKHAELNIDTIYFGDRRRNLDINYVARHAGRKTRSEIHVSGALLDESGKTFRGTIDFLRGAAQAVGHESEYNLLFSPKVRNKTAPLILCAEEDVEGQHAATTGKIDQNRLFYLMSRGLSELEAKKLVIESQFRPVTDKIPDPALRDAVSDYVKARLDTIEPIS